MAAADPTQSPKFAFDAVLFDMDGTLVATDRYWPQAAQEGAIRAFEELGLDAQPTRVRYKPLTRT